MFFECPQCAKISEYHDAMAGRESKCRNCDTHFLLPAFPEITKCPYCDGIISVTAKRCRHCTEYLDESLRRQSNSQFNPGVAAVLSFVIPGLGQIYKGQPFNGIVWFGLVVVGYLLLVVPGIILHICCIFGAASSDPRT